MATDQATLDLSITGMTCGSCVRHVIEALHRVDGVGAARVELQGGRAMVAYDPASATAEQMVRAVEEAGYQATIASGERSGEQPVRAECASSCCS
jgi:copper chaperone CopZ